MVQLLLLLSYTQVNGGECEESFRNACYAAKLAERLAIPALASQAISVRIVAACISGRGVEEPALQLQDADIDVPSVRIKTRAELDDLIGDT